MPSHMRCQNCQDNEATVHISGTKTTVPRSGAESREEEFTLHFCPSCAGFPSWWPGRGRDCSTVFPTCWGRCGWCRLRSMTLKFKRRKRSISNNVESKHNENKTSNRG